MVFWGRVGNRGSRLPLRRIKESRLSLVLGRKLLLLLSCYRLRSRKAVQLRINLKSSIFPRVINSKVSVYSRCIFFLFVFVIVFTDWFKAVLGVGNYGQSNQFMNEWQWSTNG